MLLGPISRLFAGKVVSSRQADELVRLRRPEQAAELVYRKFERILSRSPNVNQHGQQRYEDWQCDEACNFLLDCNPSTITAIFHQWTENNPSPMIQNLSVIILERLLTDPSFEGRRPAIQDIVRTLTFESSVSFLVFLVNRLSVGASAMLFEYAANFPVRQVLEQIPADVLVQILYVLRNQNVNHFEQIIGSFTPQYAAQIRERVRAMDAPTIRII